MANINYKVIQISPDDFEVVLPLKDKDLSLLEGFKVNSLFEEGNHFIQLNIYDLSGKLIYNDPQYNNYKLQLGSTKGTNEASRVQIDPIADLKAYNFDGREVRLFYNFLNNPFSKANTPDQFYITAISPDRTEIKLQSVKLTEEEIKEGTQKLIEDINSVSYQSETFLYQPQSQLLQVVNVSSEENEEGYSVLLKLYEALPSNFEIKTQFSIVERVSDAVAYEINTEVEQDEIKIPSLKGPNFNLELETPITDNSNYFNYDELFSYPNSNSYKELQSMFKEKSIDLSIDYSDFSNFIYFSSAEERLLNFKYKLDLLQQYQKNLQEVNNSNVDKKDVRNHSYYQNLIDGIIQNFDHYERYLYYENEDSSWPKINSIKPYILSGSWEAKIFKQKKKLETDFLGASGAVVTALTPNTPANVKNLKRYNRKTEILTPKNRILSDPFGTVPTGSLTRVDKYKILRDNATNRRLSDSDLTSAWSTGTPIDTIYGDPRFNKRRTWYELKLEEAREYDLANINRLTNTIPEYIKDDTSNQPYSIFIDMVGQHFDNIWIYSKAVTDKYDGDNRLNSGISRDLVAEALKNFGVKLYNSEYTTTDLFKYFTKNEYKAPREKITQRVEVGAKNKVGLKDYEQEIYKRIYHNLPLLLKSKGTERGLRALINCFGVPCETLDIKFYGGQTDLELPFFGGEQPFTASVDKIRIASDLDELYYQENSDDNPCKRPYVILSPSSATEYEYYELTQDQQRMEVGFSPTNDIDNYIVSQSQTLFPNDPFNIDHYIGDPREINSNTYAALEQYKRTILESIDSFNAKDYIRLIKFFDNVLFRMIEDFVPARVTVDTGVIIKPHILNRSKYGGVQASVTHHDYSGSLDTAFIEASHGETFTGDTRHVRRVQTPTTSSFVSRTQEQAKFDGELSGTTIKITDGELNRQNIFKNLNYPNITPALALYYKIPEVICSNEFDSAQSFSLLPFYTETDGKLQRSRSDSAKTINYRINATDFPGLYERHTVVFNKYTRGTSYPSSPKLGDVFQDTNATGSKHEQYNGSAWVDDVYENLFRTSLSSKGSISNQTHTFYTNNVDQYEEFDLLAYDAVAFSGPGNALVDDNACIGGAESKVVYCDLGTTNKTRQVVLTLSYDLTEYFTGLNVNTEGTYYVSVAGGAETSTPSPYSIPSGLDDNTEITVTYRDDNDNTCFQKVTLITTACSLQEGQPAIDIAAKYYVDSNITISYNYGDGTKSYKLVAQETFTPDVTGQPPKVPINKVRLPSPRSGNDGYLIKGNDNLEGYVKGHKQLEDAEGKVDYYIEFYRVLKDYQKAKPVTSPEYIKRFFIEHGGSTFEPILPNASDWPDEIIDGITTNSAVKLDLSQNGGKLPLYLKDGENFPTIYNQAAIKKDPGKQSGFDRDAGFRDKLNRVANESLTSKDGMAVALGAKIYAVLESDISCILSPTPYLEIEPGNYQDTFRVPIDLRATLAPTPNETAANENFHQDVCLAAYTGLLAYIELTFDQLNSVEDGGTYQIDFNQGSLQSNLGTLYATGDTGNSLTIEKAYWIRDFVGASDDVNQTVEGIQVTPSKKVAVNFIFKTHSDKFTGTHGVEKWAEFTTGTGSNWTWAGLFFGCGLKENVDGGGNFTPSGIKGIA